MGGTISQEELESWTAQHEHRKVVALETRINQLERQCAVLAAEIDRQRAEYNAEVDEFNAGYDAAQQELSESSEPSDVKYDVWKCGYAWAMFDKLKAEIDLQRQREQALSGAYLRLRRLIGREAFNTPHGPSGEQVWTTTEAALGKLVAEIDLMRPVVDGTIKQIRRDDDLFSWSDLKDAVDAYEAAKEQG